MESFEYAGQWWIPGFENEKVSGLVRFKPNEGSELELTGSLVGAEEGQNPKIINGYANGKALTLYSCFCKNKSSHRSIDLPDMSYERYSVQVVFIGHCFSAEDDIKFDELCVGFHNLENWTGITGIKFDMCPDKEDPKLFCSAKYIIPDEIEIKLNDFNMSLRHSFKNGGDEIRNLSIEQSSYFRVATSQPKHFNEYIENIVFHLQNYLSFGLNSPTYPREVVGFNNAIKESGREFAKNIDIYYGSTGHVDSEKRIYWTDMLFSYRTASDMFIQSVMNWFEKKDILKPVYDLYFASVYNSRVYLDYQFLTYIQALESFHRRMFDGDYIEDEQYKKVFEDLIKHIPEKLSRSHRDSLKSRIKYGNEFSLRKRLDELFKKHSRLKFLILRDSSKFINKVIDTRNYLTHYTEELELKASYGEDLYYLVITLKFIVQFCILISMGFSEEKAIKIVQENREFRHSRF